MMTDSAFAPAPSSAASAGGDFSADGDGNALSFLRTHLSYAFSNLRSVVGFRAMSLLRGIRGVDGTRWARRILTSPSMSVHLLDTRAACAAPVLQHLVTGLISAHAEEERRLVLHGEAAADSAARFSQHHDGRHAGQSGKWWLESAASADAAKQMAICVAHAQALLPQLWLGDGVPRLAQPITTD